MVLVLKIRQRRTDFLYLTLCISSGLHSGFSLPTFLSHASPWSTAKQRNISIQHQVSTCLWVYACLCMSLSARGCNWGLPLSPSLISTSTVPVCWHPAIHTQFSSIWWENKMVGKKKKDKASQKIYRKWLLMLRSSRSDLQWEHPGVSWEAQIQYHSFSWLGALCNPINRFLWKPQSLWWAIKAYLHSVPLKGSEAPERSCVWSDISVSLHSLLCCHDLGYTIKKPARTRAWIQWHHPDHISHICELPLLRLFI